MQATEMRILRTVSACEQLGMQGTWER